MKLLLDSQVGIETVGEGEGIDDGLARVQELKPDVVLLDLVMHGRISLEAIPALRRASPETSVVVLSTLDDVHYAREAFTAGASAYVLKEGAPVAGDEGRGPTLCLQALPYRLCVPLGVS